MKTTHTPFYLLFFLDRREKCNRRLHLFLTSPRLVRWLGKWTRTDPASLTCRPRYILLFLSRRRRHLDPFSPNENKCEIRYRGWSKRTEGSVTVWPSTKPHPSRPDTSTPGRRQHLTPVDADRHRHRRRGEEGTAGTTGGPRLGRRW